MKKALIVVDMQNDFVDGSLGTKEAQKIVEAVEKKVKAARGNGDRTSFHKRYPRRRLPSDKRGEVASGYPLCQRNRRLGDHRLPEVFMLTEFLTRKLLEALLWLIMLPSKDMNPLSLSVSAQIFVLCQMHFF